jgi:hypothetical protein
MKGAQGALKLGIGKIGTPHPGIKIFQTQIYRIGPFGNGGV